LNTLIRLHDTTVRLVFQHSVFPLAPALVPPRLGIDPLNTLIRLHEKMASRHKLIITESTGIAPTDRVLINCRHDRANFPPRNLFRYDTSERNCGCMKIKSECKSPHNEMRFLIASAAVWLRVLQSVDIRLGGIITASPQDNSDTYDTTWRFFRHTRRSDIAP